MVHQCDRCGRVFTRAENLWRHVKLVKRCVRKPPADLMMCGVCGLLVPDLQAHELLNHRSKGSILEVIQTESPSILAPSPPTTSLSASSTAPTPASDVVAIQVEEAFDGRFVVHEVGFRSGVDIGLLAPVEFVEAIRPVVVRLLREASTKHASGIKASLEVYCRYARPMHDDDSSSCKCFSTSCVIINRSDDPELSYATLAGELCHRCDEFSERDSGWSLVRVDRVRVDAIEYSPIAGGVSSYMPLPAAIVRKFACLNIENQLDQACFAWCIVASMHPAAAGVNPKRTGSYPRYDQVLDVEGFTWPMPLREIDRFERLNDVSVNVFGLKRRGNDQSVVGPYHHAAARRAHHVNLLLVEGAIGEAHYVLIKDMGRLVGRQIRNHHGQLWICDGCLIHFTQRARYVAHVQLGDCNRVVTLIPEPGTDGAEIRFRGRSKQMDVPFVIYADFECAIVPI